MADNKMTDYLTRVAPQCLADILIQVFRDDGIDENTIYAFHLGECLSNWIDGLCNLDGKMRASLAEKAALERAALHLERHARMIRDALTAPFIEEPE